MDIKISVNSLNIIKYSCAFLFNKIIHPFADLCLFQGLRHKNGSSQGHV